MPEPIPNARSQYPLQIERSRAWLTLIIPATVYAVLVLCAWAPFTLFSGMPYESTFTFKSESTTKLNGFLYDSDATRIHTSTFYHLAYLLAEWCRVGGTFVTYQIVYAVLWWARGFLVYLVLRRFLPGQDVFAFLTGCLVVVHAADGALNWVGQLNQFGFMFWMILGFYCLVLARQAASIPAMLVFLVLAMVFEHMSLWSYESQICLICLAPVLLLFLPQRLTQRGRLGVIAGGWYAVVVVYLALALRWYLQRGGSTYQARVMRTEFSFQAIVADLGHAIQHSTNFLNWGANVSNMLTSHETQSFVAVAIVAVFMGWIGLCWVTRSRRDSTQSISLAVGAALLGVGIVLLVSSYPVYLLLNSARSHWRTQFLSGFGFALALAGAGVMCGRCLSRSQLVASVPALVLCLMVVHSGTRTALCLGKLHRQHWEELREGIAGILHIAPRLEQNTIVVVTNVKSHGQGARDRFGHNMWFDVALRLAYPKTAVSGVYFLDDGRPSKGANLKLDGDRWRWDQTGFPPVVRETMVEHTIAFAYDDNGTLRLLRRLPACMHADPDAARKYSSQSVILPGPVPARVVRRYGPIPSGAVDYANERRSEAAVGEAGD
jgi:hypothetical protein